MKSDSKTKDSRARHKVKGTVTVFTANNKNNVLYKGLYFASGISQNAKDQIINRVGKSIQDDNCLFLEGEKVENRVREKKGGK